MKVSCSTKLRQTSFHLIYFSQSRLLLLGGISLHLCDEIGRFIALWATFQSLCRQLFCPNYPHFQAIFVQVSKSFIFVVKSYLGTFWRLYTGHTGLHPLIIPRGKHELVCCCCCCFILNLLMRIFLDSSACYWL